MDDFEYLGLSQEEWSRLSPEDCKELADGLEIRDRINARSDRFERWLAEQPTTNSEDWP